jgi:voltage-gated potassium channel Kch
VVGWAWLLGSLLSLVQEKAFQQALVDRRFRRAVERFDDPFYLVCGLGDTGMAVVRALQQIGCRLTVIDKDERKVQQLEIDGSANDTPAMVADARSPETLSAAGLLKPECKGVLTLCNDDETNLAVAIAASILRPGLPVIGRADTPAAAASMSSLGTYRVINPFREFGEHLALAMRAPDVYRLIAWLTSAPGAYLFPTSPSRIPVAPGHWVVCGHGRFGREVVSAVQRSGFTTTIVDPAGSRIDGHRAIKGRGADIEILHEAGIEKAAGVIAGADDDAGNLAVGIAARRINPDIFIILRQNLRTSRMLFTKFGANITMVPSEIIASQCIAALRTPLLADFLDAIKTKDDFWAYALSERLRNSVGNKTPRFWSVALDHSEAPGFIASRDGDQRPMTVDDLTKDGVLVLRVIRATTTLELPDGDCELLVGDNLLCAGSAAAEANQRSFLRTGNRIEPRNPSWRKIARGFWLGK